jgi:hypothetical protein
MRWGFAWPNEDELNRLAFPLFFTLAVLSAVSAVFFYAKVRERDALLDRFIAETTRATSPNDTDAVVIALSDAIFTRTNNGIEASRLPLYERLESTSFFNVTTAVSLKHGIYGVIGHSQYGPCGTMTRTLLAALWRLRIPARKLQLLGDPTTSELDGHTMVEFHSNGRWQVISPSDSSFAWRTADGRIATLEEIQGDSTVFAQVFRPFPRYPYRFDHASHIRWEKLPHAARLFFRWVLGDKGYRNAYTPSLYDQPRHLFLLLSVVGLFVFGALATISRQAERRHLAHA